MNDLISRQAAIAEFDCCELTPDGGIDANYAIDFLMNMPSAERIGHWVQISPAKIYECSECGQNVMTINIDVYRYCPNCGARMEKGDAE